MIAKMQVFDT